MLLALLPCTGVLLNNKTLRMFACCLQRVAFYLPVLLTTCIRYNCCNRYSYNVEMGQLNELVDEAMVLTGNGDLVVGDF